MQKYGISFVLLHMIFSVNSKVKRRDINGKGFKGKGKFW